MNKWILAAGLLSLFTLVVHVFAGGPEVHDTMLNLAGAFPHELQTFISIMWHAITAILAVNSAALLLAARSPSSRNALVSLVVCQYMAYAALFIFYGITRLGTLLLLPQWIVFILMSMLAAAGLRVSSRSTAPAAI